MGKVSKRSLFSALVIGSIVLGLVGLNSPITQINAQTSTQSVGFVRFAHTAIDVGPVDIYQGESGQTPLVTNLSYGEFTDFLTLKVTTTGFVAREAGTGPTGKVLSTANWGVKANESVILTVAGLASNREILLEPILIIRNDVKDQARIRVVNMIWGTHLSVRSGNNLTLGKGLGPLGLSDLEVAPGKYPLDVVDDTEKEVASLSDVELRANTIYTIMLVGGKDGNPAITITNIASDQDTSRVKIINKASGSVDIYDKALGTLFVSDVASGADTGFVAMPSRDVTFQVRDAGSAADSNEIAVISTQLRPERDVTIVINPNHTMEITEEVLTPPNKAVGTDALATSVATATPQTYSPTTQPTQAMTETATATLPATSGATIEATSTGTSEMTSTGTPMATIATITPTATAS